MRSNAARGRLPIRSYHANARAQPGISYIRDHGQALPPGKGKVRELFQGCSPDLLAIRREDLEMVDPVVALITVGPDDLLVAGHLSQLDFIRLGFHLPLTATCLLMEAQKASAGSRSLAAERGNVCD